MTGTDQRALFQDTIGLHQTELPSNTYDAVVVAGGFVQGHCPPEAFDEMIRICKPGNCCSVARWLMEDYWHRRMKGVGNPDLGVPLGGGGIIG